jgi:glutathione S-transferase
MLTLYQFEISPFCDKIRRVLHWKRQPYTVREVPLSQAFTAVKKVNPIGKLPCLEDEGRFIADSTDIAHYLEERFPEPALIPRDPKLRGLCHMLEDWADESLYFYEMRLRFTLPHNARKHIPSLTAHDPAWMKTAARYAVPPMMRGILKRQGLGRKPVAMVVRDLERHVDAIASWLGEGEWLVGDALSLADISVFAELACIRDTDEGGKVIEARPAVASWMARVDRATAKPV